MAIARGRITPIALFIGLAVLSGSVPAAAQGDAQTQVTIGLTAVNPVDANPAAEWIRQHGLRNIEPAKHIDYGFVASLRRRLAERWSVEARSVLLLNQDGRSLVLPTRGGTRFSLTVGPNFEWPSPLGRLFLAARPGVVRFSRFVELSDVWIYGSAIGAELVSGRSKVRPVLDLGGGSQVDVGRLIVRIEGGVCRVWLTFDSPPDQPVHGVTSYVPFISLSIGAGF